MFCLPACQACKIAGSCPKEGQAYRAPRAPVKRKRMVAPSEQGLMRAPCGCLCLPVELVRCLGERFETFYCDAHGPIKVTAKWKREVKGILPPMVRIPSEFGYQVAIQETL